MVPENNKMMIIGDYMTNTGKKSSTRSFLSSAFSRSKITCQANFSLSLTSERWWFNLGLTTTCNYCHSGSKVIFPVKGFGFHTLCQWSQFFFLMKTQINWWKLWILNWRNYWAGFRVISFLLTYTNLCTWSIK